ncbi:MAG: RNA methyltransferase [Anaerolineales bacterium]|nr:MAG: RNA methyltransferase [Anaerolineales bacterium]
MISSTQNPRVQHIRALQGRAKERRQANAFVVEGVRLAEEVLAAGWKVKQGFYTAELDPRGMELVTAFKNAGAEMEEVTGSVMEAASDTTTPAGLLLEVQRQPVALAAALDLVVILDRVNDPGNVGTLLRSAAAAGAHAAVLAPGCVDPFAPKVLRGGMGAQLRLPVLELDWVAIRDLLAEHGLHPMLAEANIGRPFDEVDLTRKLAFIVGGEANGPSAEARGLGAEPIQIRMPGQIESLNAATAGSLLLFEAVRQRRPKA